MRAAVIALLALGVAACASRPLAPRPSTPSQDVAGLSLRAEREAVAPGDSAVFTVRYEPDRPGRTGPMYGNTCGWRVERWDGAEWAEATRDVWRAPPPPGVLEGCTSEGYIYSGAMSYREGFIVRAGTAAGSYRWCFDVSAGDGEGRATVCSNAFRVLDRARG